MLTVGGIIVVLISVMVGFTMAGGHMHSLVHPSEIVTIGGAALGALIASSPKKVLVDLVHGLIAVLKGDPCNRAAYVEVFKLMFELFQIARRDGLLAWEAMLSDPHHDPIFAKYPRVVKNHHLLEFVTGAMSQGMEGTPPEQLELLLNKEIEVHHEEHHAAVAALSRTADALPGFGIVAAVLGIVVTMGSISGPVEVIGEKVGAALVGTFLGILLSYGIIGPVVGIMETMGNSQTSFLKTVASAFVSFVGGGAAKGVLENLRRGIGTDCRPTVKDMEEIFKSQARA